MFMAVHNERSKFNLEPLDQLLGLLPTRDRKAVEAREVEMEWIKYLWLYLSLKFQQGMVGISQCL